MGKRFYIVLFCALILSLGLLTVTYSKESGDNGHVSLIEEETDEYRVIYSSNIVNTSNDNDIVVSLINKSDEDTSYNLVINSNNLESDVYYSVNGGEESKLNNGYISLGELKSFGNDGDQATYVLNFRCDENIDSFELGISINEDSSLIYSIKNDENTYVDNNGNIRYYGELVNNYINYDNELYRIIGIIDGKVKLISEIKGLGVYSTNLGNYVTLEDYLYSFNVDGITEDNVLDYSSWMTGNNAYWLSDVKDNKAYYVSKSDGVSTSSKYVSYYRRIVVDLDESFNIDGGDGTESNPYEVSYGG